MSRKVFDVLASAGGALIVIVLVVAGSLLMVGYSFANSNVHNQLAEQQIVFPSQAAFAHPVAGSEITPSMVGTVSKYAGQELTTGQQAQVYANDFIAVHLNEIGGGKTYAQLSQAAMALPKGSVAYTAAEAKVQTVFQGTTLRGIAARGLRIQRLRGDRPLGCDCLLRLGGPDGPAGDPRGCPCSEDRRRRGAARAHRHRAGAGPGHRLIHFPPCDTTLPGASTASGRAA